MVREIISIRLVFLLLLPMIAFAQPKYGESLREGNDAYADGRYAKAEQEYRKGLEANPESPDASFNLGDALYKQERFEEALQVFQESYNKARNDNERAASLHNLGNAFYKGGKYKEAAQAYSQGLKLNPNDEETRYNLAQSLRKIQIPPPKEEQQNQNNQPSSPEEQKPQDQPKSGDQDDEQQDGKEGQQQDSESNDGKEFNEEPQAEGELNKEEAERLLDVLDEQEAQLQKKLKEQKAKKPKKKTEKDW